MKTDLFLLLVYYPSAVTSFLSSTFFKAKSQALQSSVDQPSSDIKYYEHDGWKLSYRFQSGEKSSPTLILIHPVGIGLSSWFFSPFIEAWNGIGGFRSDVYAPDLIGCGIYGDTWSPDERGLFFPLDWVRGVETLISQEVKGSSCIVVAQGGLAPVGLMLASRNISGKVKGLVLTSPPSWTEMITAIPDTELLRNFEFLKSPIFGSLAFSILERPAIIRFFSDLFLFGSKSDEEWVKRASEECSGRPSLRPPIMAFNAGLCNHRSFEEELKTLQVPTLVVSGSGDKRMDGRTEYGSDMYDCELATVKGMNVLPWESPEETCKVIERFYHEKISTSPAQLSFLEFWKR